MKVKSLDGKIYDLGLTGYLVNSDETKPRSDLHIQARQIIKDRFPLFMILEEVLIQVRQNSSLYLDFFIPQTKLCIEVNGRQHFEFIPHFHKNIFGFKMHEKRDREKKLWLDLNGISLIEFNYNEDVELWKNKLK